MEQSSEKTSELCSQVDCRSGQDGVKGQDERQRTAPLTPPRPLKENPCQKSLDWSRRCHTRKLVPQSGITSGLPVIRELEEICASCAPTQLLPGIASAYFLSSIANTWPSTVLSAVSAYWTRAFMPLKSVQGFMEPLGT